MKTSEFYFNLPEALIAQSPADRRDASRLLFLDKRTGDTRHHRFYELPSLLRAGDCLVLNDSRVIPARLFGRRQQTAGGSEPGAVVEVVLLRDRGDHVWECLTRPGRKTKTGTRLFFGNSSTPEDSLLSGQVVDEIEGGNRLIRFDHQGVFLEVLDRLGQMPLPPYIRQALQDPERYQTVYARAPGSAAAPTAGLHFTPELLQELENNGVHIHYVTLHVGLGTFRPVKTEDIEDHEMHAEYCEIPQETAEAVNEARREERRVIAVGTTSCRTLESRAAGDGVLAPYAGFTNAFIYPGYRFKCVDGLITNFHLPESTLIMLVSALAGREHVLKAYDEAIRERYRFFSFGDAMLIL
jgi:S-adenosylmethionine:tRNA ribosyltransferase-isomerase